MNFSFRSGRSLY